MTKHRMFGAPNVRQSKKKFTHPLVVMVETFRMSVPCSRCPALPAPGSAPIVLSLEQNCHDFLIVERNYFQVTLSL